MDQRIVKYFRKELSQKERLDLLHEAFSNSELKQQMMEYQNLHALVQLHPRNTQKKDGEEKYASFVKKRIQHYSRKAFSRRLYYAAALAACVFLTFQITYLIMKPAAISHAVLSQTLTVPAGQRAHIILPDGSKVWVNAGSEIKYQSVFGKERRVQLRGEAFFEVEKGKIPFIVSTSKADVKVYGTRFNVFSYPHEYLSVSLLNGSVRVFSPHNEEDGIMLKPGQQLREDAKGYQIVGLEEEPLLWKDGLYAFNKQKFRDVLKRLEIYYNVKITVKKPSLLEYVYTGKFRQNDGVMEVLRILQKIHSFRVTKLEETNEIIIY